MEIDRQKLLLHLKSCLPEYMVPKTLMELASFPMTTNGKIDRKVLHAIKDSVSLEKNIVSLESDLERDIAQIWSEILKIDSGEIGRFSNFFELGGNSLLVIKMLAKLRKKTDLEIPLAQFITLPTIAMLTKNTAAVSHAKHAASVLMARLRKDCVLDPNIRPLTRENKKISNPKVIFLTGATGFLGAHLLCELLQSCDATIYCLVRATDQNAAKDRIINALRKYQILDNIKDIESYSGKNYLDRIIPMLGELTQLRLGLADSDFNLLEKNCYAIYHVAANVHHVFDYTALYAANVQSSLELLKLAVTGQNKALHFISTLGTQLISPLEQLPLAVQGSTINLLNLNGYLVSKWVTENVLQEAYDRKIAVTVYRPGNIIAGAKAVYDAETNHTLLRLKGMLQLEKAYVSNEDQVEMMPVDLLAQAIAAISRKPQKFSYNLQNPNVISWHAYLNLAKSMGFNFEFIQNKKDWDKLLSSIKEDNALYKLSHFYESQEAVDEETGASVLPSDYPFATPSYEEMIKKQLKSLIASGFLPSPKNQVSQVSAYST